MANESTEHDFHCILSGSLLVHFPSASYRGFYHGALSFRDLSGLDLVHSLLSWFLSRCTLLSLHIVVFIAVHFPFALYQVHTWCTSLYRGLHHGASSFRVISWSLTPRCMLFRVISWSPFPRCILAFLYHGVSIMVH